MRSAVQLWRLAVVAAVTAAVAGGVGGGGACCAAAMHGTINESVRTTTMRWE